LFPVLRCIIALGAPPSVCCCGVGEVLLLHSMLALGGRWLAVFVVTPSNHPGHPHTAVEC
jgi:hypothetical protein